MKNNLTWRQLLTAGIKMLSQHSIASAKIDAQQLLHHVSNFSSAQFILCEHEIVSPTQQLQFFDYIKKRCQQKPLARIIGTKKFYNIELKIADDVFEPRSDSECLVDIILHRVAGNKFAKNMPVHFADLGCGSGALVLALLKNLPLATALATDINPAALALTKKNAEDLQLANRLLLKQGDWLDALANNKKKFDFIICNPPYIASSALKALEKPVLFDPLLALDGGENGLDIYKKLLKKIDFFLDKHGFFAYELGYDQADVLKNLSLENGWVIKNEAKDIGGHIRAIIVAK